MGKRFPCLLLVFLMLICPGSGLGEMNFPHNLSSQEALLQDYMKQVNICLREMGQRELDTVFECYPTFAVLGYGDTDVPENLELSVEMSAGSLDVLELRTSDFRVFPVMCACLMACAEGSPEKASDLVAVPLKYVQKAEAAPSTSFEDPVVREKGDKVRVYYRYELNPWGNSVNELVMTLVFPREAGGDGGITTPPPSTTSEKILDGSDDEGDYTPYDEGTHLEIFLTPTPEPDSAAGYVP